MPSSHDAGYKLLFSNPLIVRDLIQGFVDDPWLQKLDFSTLEPVKGHYVSEDLRDRADDVVWRVRSGEDWLYLYLLIEFQSRSDRFMALRMMVYVGLLYQDLIHNKQLGPQGLLPPVLPIVLYNGERRWRASVTLADLLPKVPAFLAPLQPQMRYLLIDEGAIPANTLARLPSNLVAAIFKLEQPQTPEAVQEVVTELEAATRSDEYATVRRIVAIWIRAALIRNRKYPILLPELNDLQELRIMLTQRIEQWAEGYLAAGRKEGRMEGHSEGRLEGRLEGEIAVLARLLTRRFGPLPAWAEARLHAATEQNVADWADAILDAAGLTDVLGPPPADH